MADDNFKQNKKDAEEMYQTQLRIAKVIKEQTNDFKTYSDAVKKVKENGKIIKETEKEIARLLAVGTKEAEAQAEALRKEVEYTKSLNKELLKTGNLIRASAKSLGGWGMEKLIGLGKDLLDVYNKMDSSARRTTIQMGMSYNRMEQFRNTSVKAARELALMGLSAEATGEMLAAYGEETGRQLLLSKQTVVSMGQLSQRVGMSHQEMAGLAGQMEAFGLSSTSSAKMIEGIADTADRMGVNTSKVMKNVQKNIGLLNRLNFKDGVKGMARMAMYAEKYKLSMEASAGFAEKVMRPEGAIEAAASLQVLGGSLAQLGDPFQLMAQARNDPEAFAKNITKAAAASAEWNAATGEFKVSAYELERLREVSESTGISLDELVQTAKQGAKISMFENALKIKGDDKEFLSTVMEADQMGAFVIDTDGAKKYLKDQSASEQQAIANRLKADKDGSKARATEAQTTQELIENNLKALQATMLGGVKELDDRFRPAVKDFLEGIQKWAASIEKFLKWVPYLIVGLMALQVLIPILQGVGTVFTVLTKGISGLGRGLKSLIGGKGGAGGGGMSDMVQSKKGDWYKSDSPQGKMIRTKGGTQPLGGGQSGAGAGANPSQVGESSGKSAGNMLKGAAAILVLSAALFVFAKALQEFDKLQNGWQTLAMAAVSLVILSGALFLVGQIMGKATTNILMGSIAILALGVALIPFAYAMQMIKDVGVGTMLGAALALAAFALAAGLMGAFLPFILLGSIAIVALSGALMLFGLALQIVAPGMEMFLSSLSKLPSLIGPLFLFGPALGIAALGIGALSISLFALGAAWWFGGSAFKGLTGSLAAMKGLDLSGLSKSVSAINRVDLEKIEALRDLALSLSLVNLFGGIKVEFGDIDVNGTINLKSGSGVSKGTDWVNDPIFVSKLKNLIWESMHKGKKGGKS